MNIRIRIINEDEIHSVNEVYNVAYGNIRPDKFYEWEFLKGTWGKAIYIVAEDQDRTGNKIIGTQCAIPIKFINSEGKEILTAKSEDTYVHPEYRGHKLFDSMYDLLFAECKKANIQYIWGFTYARKPFEKIGFEIPFETIQGISVNSISKSYNYLALLNSKNNYIEKLKIYTLCIYSYIVFSILYIFSFSKIDHIVEEFNFKIFYNLFQKILRSNKNLWSINKTNNYFQWRLIDNPFNNLYSQLSFYEGSNSIANVIINRRKEGFIYIEEMIFDNSITTKNKIYILKSLFRYIKKKYSYSLIRFWGFPTNQINKEEISLLKKCGFVFVNKGTYFVWKTLVNENNIEPFNILISRLYTQGNR